PNYRELACRVRQKVWESQFAADRCDVHDATLQPLFHAGKNSERGVDGTPEVDAHHLLEIGEAHVFHWADEDRSCVIDEHIDWTQRIFNRGEQRLYLGAIRHVALRGEKMLSSRGKFLPYGAKIVFVTGANRYTSAQRGEFPCHDEPQAARAARDQHNFCIQIPIS